MSMGEPFTEAARAAIAQAQDEAVRKGYGFIAPEHIITAVAGGSDDVARLMTDAGASAAALRDAIPDANQPGTPQSELVFSPDAKRLIQCALLTAKDFGDAAVGARHLVGAIALMPESTANGVLASLGVDANKLREQLRALPEQGPPIATIVTSRRTYAKSELLEASVLPNPIAQLQSWLDEALAAQLIEPNAMSIATADAQGSPSARIVLLRGLDNRGLVFFTSYFSRKGRELSENPRAAALFYWPQLERQVRVEGPVEQVSEDESDAYFATRPRGHRLSAWASEQSEGVESRDLLDQRLRDYDERFEGEEVPRPHSWGGYLLRPERFEFWQGRPNRMHDRLEYLRERNAWTLRRLQP